MSHRTTYHGPPMACADTADIVVGRTRVVNSGPDLRDRGYNGVVTRLRTGSDGVRWLYVEFDNGQAGWVLAHNMDIDPTGGIR